MTALRPGRRDRVGVELDGAPWRTLPAAAVVAARLAPGVELDRPRARELARARRQAEALDLAARALGRRDRSAQALSGYLARRGVAPAERAQAVERLSAAGYVDDARYAAGRAIVLAQRGYGDEAIRFELGRAGVAGEQAEAALESLPPERERAVAALARARTPLAGIRALAAKGFAADSIEAAAAEARLDLGA